MEELQRVRSQFPASDEAALAADWNAILYRLHLRSKVPYAFSDRSLPREPSQLEDVVAMMTDQRNRLVVAMTTAVRIYDSAGTSTHSILAQDVQSVFPGLDGRIVVGTRGGIRIWDPSAAGVADPYPVKIPKTNGEWRDMDGVPAGVVTPLGGYLLADRVNRQVTGFAPERLTYKARFSGGNPERMAVNDLGDVAFIDHDTRQVLIVDAFGEQVAKIGPQLSNPVDLRFDAPGHLYVLDQARRSVFVFRLPLERNGVVTSVATFTVGEREPGEFRKALAFSLASAGRLSIYDERQKRILFYH
jgi:hypothetical protein